MAPLEQVLSSILLQESHSFLKLPVSPLAHMESSGSEYAMDSATNRNHGPNPSPKNKAAGTSTLKSLKYLPKMQRDDDSLELTSDGAYFSMYMLFWLNSICKTMKEGPMKRRPREVTPTGEDFCLSLTGEQVHSGPCSSNSSQDKSLKSSLNVIGQWFPSANINSTPPPTAQGVRPQEHLFRKRNCEEGRLLGIYRRTLEAKRAASANALGQRGPEVYNQQEQQLNRNVLLQASMSFKDVTVEFTQEEWQKIGPTQWTLYRDVMLEIYSHLVSVGYCYTKPEVIFRLEQAKDPCLLEKEFLIRRFSDSENKE
ncbi:PREDICTED: uncharacterized protein LOC101377621 [Odobenus rosmarus divergens]|uniref:Uncharacterized protein LOC101377621 n=1 Tax=Odobenus rosmarus divergens TaxID=9708 RepID=A0A9B0GYA3_ODORO